MTSMGAGAVGGAASQAFQTGALVGLEQGLFAAIGALVVGLSTRAITSYRRVGRDAANSPYRYLTLLEHAGVTFRSADTAPSRD